MTLKGKIVKYVTIMMGILKVDLFKVNHLGLDLIEYLLLMKLHGLNNNLNYPVFYKLLDVEKSYYDCLVDKGYLKKELFDKYVLTSKANELFDVGDTKFEEFYEMYPQKVPDGIGGFRPVSTNDPNSKSAGKTRDLFRKITEGNATLADEIISGLKIELDHRNASGSMQYLPNIDSWLNGHNWEKWIDMGSEKSGDNIKNNIKKI